MERKKYEMKVYRPGEGREGKKLIAASLIALAVILGIVCAVFWISVRQPPIQGTYVSEDGEYTVELFKDGDCRWCQDGTYFDGQYEKIEDTYELNILGNGIYLNTTFVVNVVAEDLYITGGRLDQTRFIKIDDRL